MHRSSKTLLLVSALLSLVLSCRSEASEQVTVDPVHSELRTAMAGTFSIGEMKIEFARMAILVAQSGCADADIHLEGEPTRLLVAHTDLIRVSSGFVVSNSQFNMMGPGGSGSVPVLVVAVEGPGELTPGKRSPTDRAFIFVEPLVNPEFTTCTIKNAPLLLESNNQLYGSFEFDLLEIPD
mgnify:FL=1